MTRGYSLQAVYYCLYPERAQRRAGRNRKWSMLLWRSADSSWPETVQQRQPVAEPAVLTGRWAAEFLSRGDAWYAGLLQRRLQTTMDVFQNVAIPFCRQQHITSLSINFWLTHCVRVCVCLNLTSSSQSTSDVPMLELQFRYDIDIISSF